MQISLHFSNNTVHRKKETEWMLNILIAFIYDLHDKIGEEQQGIVIYRWEYVFHPFKEIKNPTNKIKKSGLS